MSTSDNPDGGLQRAVHTNERGRMVTMGSAYDVRPANGDDLGEKQV